MPAPSTTPLRRILDFRGRARRTEFWMVQLLFWIVLAGCLMFAAYSDGPVGGTAFMLTCTVFLIAVVPFLAVEVRRFHDQARSGYFILLNAIPYLGPLIVLVFMCLPGTKGPNAYGPDPRERL